MADLSFFPLLFAQKGPPADHGLCGAVQTASALSTPQPILAAGCGAKGEGPATFDQVSNPFGVAFSVTLR